MNADRIQQRVKKLLALADDDGASPGEVENALRMARELMTKFGLEDADFTESDPELVDVDAYDRCGMEPWMKGLGTAVGHVCDVQCYTHTVRGRRPRVTIRFVGAPQDVELARHLYNRLRVLVPTLARTVCGGGWAVPHRSFALGFTVGLRQQAREAQQEAQQAHAIVLRKDVRIRQWMDDNLNLRYAKSKPVQMCGASYTRGKDAGRAVRVSERKELSR